MNKVFQIHDFPCILRNQRMLAFKPKSTKKYGTDTMVFKSLQIW